MHCWFVVLILFNTGLCKSAFSTNSFRKLFFIVLRFLSLLTVIVEFDVIFINLITFAQSLFIQVYVICVFVLSYEKQFVKGATKSDFTHYSCVVNVLFNTALYRSAFSPVSFRNLGFRLSVLSLNQVFEICIIKLCNFDLQFCSHFIQNLTFYN